MLTSIRIIKMLRQRVDIKVDNRLLVPYPTPCSPLYKKNVSHRNVDCCKSVKISKHFEPQQQEVGHIQ